MSYTPNAVSGDLSTATTATPPSEADLVSALGTPSAVGRQISQLNEAGLARNEYLTLSDGAAFWSALLAKARLASSTATAANAASTQTTPTYDGSGQAVEPMVLFFPDSWPATGTRYKYWMAVTPYPGGNAAFENPSMLAGNDGTTWVVPTGMTNPIVPAPGSGNNGDPWIVMDPTNTTMWYYYVVAASASCAVWVMSSTNGVTWSTPVSLFSVGHAAGCIAPVVVYDGTQYVLYTENFSAPTTSTLEQRTCATPNGTFSSATTCTVSGAPAGRTITDSAFYKRGVLWHSFAVWWNGVTGGAADYQLYFMESSDGLAWTCAAAPLIAPSVSGWDSLYVYRASGVPTATGYDLWYSADNGSAVWHVGRTTLSLNNLTLEDLGRQVAIRDRTVNILNFGGTLEEAALAYATDTNRLGIYSGGRWNWSANLADIAALTSATLAGLADVTVSSPLVGQLLTYNGTKWANSAPASHELLMQNGVTFPPVPLTNEAGTDWLYGG